MQRTPKEVTGFHGKLKYVDTCPNPPVTGKAFCEEHCKQADAAQVPTQLKEYLKYCTSTNNGICNHYNIHKSDLIINFLLGLFTDTKSTQQHSHTAADCQGTRSILTKFPAIAKPLDEECPETQTTCNKDTGQPRRMQKWTRGVWFCVGGGGHITTWQPLYQWVYKLIIEDQYLVKQIV